MTITRAEESKNYRFITGADGLHRDKLRKRESRLKQKDIKEDIHNEASKIMFNKVYKLKNDKKPINKDSFLKNTWNPMLKLHKDFTGEQFVNMKWARKWKSIILFIKTEYIYFKNNINCINYKKFTGVQSII